MPRKPFSGASSSSSDTISCRHVLECERPQTLYDRKLATIMFVTDHFSLPFTQTVMLGWGLWWVHVDDAMLNLHRGGLEAIVGAMVVHVDQSRWRSLKWMAYDCAKCWNAEFSLTRLQQTHPASPTNGWVVKLFSVLTQVGSRHRYSILPHAEQL